MAVFLLSLRFKDNSVCVTEHIYFNSVTVLKHTEYYISLKFLLWVYTTNFSTCLDAGTINEGRNKTRVETITLLRVYAWVMQ